MRPTIALAAASLALLLTACGGAEDEGSATMRPGENCLGCHGFKAAGTVFGSASAAASAGLSGAVVTLDDGVNAPVSATTNSAGNFIISGTVNFPNTATIARGGQTASHVHASQNGGCNSCHGGGNRLHVP